MHRYAWTASFAILSFLSLNSYAQSSVYINPGSTRDHVVDAMNQIIRETIHIDSSLIVSEVFEELYEGEVEPWKEWAVVENFTFGLNRGTLTMIADLNALHPFFRDKVKELIRECKKKGIELAVVETYRTHAKQNEYKIMGRNYTNSAGGRSKHQYGLAVDVVPIVNGRAVWNNTLLWKKIGMTGEKIGLRWGGRWRRPYDPGHFEWTAGLTSAHLAAGMLPPVPAEKYPCLEEDIEALREYWAQWESEQSATSRR